jgi:hypothetical protein
MGKRVRAWGTKRDKQEAGAERLRNAQGEGSRLHGAGGSRSTAHGPTVHGSRTPTDTHGRPTVDGHGLESGGLGSGRWGYVPAMGEGRWMQAGGGR